jgi:hypothetical protein
MTEAGSISRRQLLRYGTVVASVGAASLSISPAAGAASRTGAGRRLPAPDPLKRSTFAPLVGEAFTMTGAGGARRAVLAEVNDLRPETSAGNEDRFALVFKVAPGRNPAGGVKEFRHPRLGSVSLFAGPVDRGVKAARYEAVINR